MSAESSQPEKKLAPGEKQYSIQDVQILGVEIDDDEEERAKLELELEELKIKCLELTLMLNIKLKKTNAKRIRFQFLYSKLMESMVKEAAKSGSQPKPAAGSDSEPARGDNLEQPKIDAEVTTARKSKKTH